MSATSPPTGSAYLAAPPRRPVGHRSHRLSRHLDLSSRLSRRQPPQAINRCRPHRLQPDRSRWRHRNLPSPAIRPSSQPVTQPRPAPARLPTAGGPASAHRPRAPPMAPTRRPRPDRSFSWHRRHLRLRRSVGLGRVAPSATLDADVELTQPATGEDAVSPDQHRAGHPGGRPVAARRCSDAMTARRRSDLHLSANFAPAVCQPVICGSRPTSGC